MGSLLWVEKETPPAAGLAHPGVDPSKEGVDGRIVLR
jgi:hypothetical protein